MIHNLQDDLTLLRQQQEESGGSSNTLVAEGEIAESDNGEDNYTNVCSFYICFNPGIHDMHVRLP